MRCVRPDLTMPANSRPLRSKESASFPTSSASVLPTAIAAMWSAVGNVSLVDWPGLTSSLGLTAERSPRGAPRISAARPARTSLTFM